MNLPRSLKELINGCIDDAIKEAKAEVDISFAVQIKDVSILKDSVYAIYDSLRSDLEKECYHGKNGNNEHPLDYRKGSAILCCALIKEKAFSFNDDEAVKIASQKESSVNELHGKKRKEYNQYLVNNLLINYKVAYLAALHFLYFFTLYEALGKEWKNTNGEEIYKQLSETGHLCRYTEYPGEEADDSYDVSMIIGLARADLLNKKIDVYLLALHFYQIEMYTRLALQTGQC
jgi:hypothetical protein